MNRVILSIIFAGLCPYIPYAQQQETSLNGVGYVLEKAQAAFYCIPDHKRVDDAAKPYMTEDLYESLAAAWDIPDWTDGEMKSSCFIS